MSYNDTIAAIATPRGVGGVAMIRISGTDAVETAAEMFEVKGGLSQLEARRAVYGRIYLTGADGRRRCIDDGIAVVFRAPASFTGEDTVEITCHGGTLVTRSVLLAALACGARQAEAGEFTRRAFVNGKLGLTEAEALGSLLYASTENQLALARGGMSGALCRGIGEIYEKLLAVSTAIRASMDFPEEDLSELTPDEIIARLGEASRGISELASTFSTGRAVTEGIDAVICGRTNAGKSTLYNRIVGHDAAIVTAVEGTTRDILSEYVSFGGVTLRLQDTAGLRPTDDPVEKIGVERAAQAIENAELIFAVFDGSRSLDGDDLVLIKKLTESRARVFAVINKTDAENGQESGTVNTVNESFGDVFGISAKTGDGISALADAVKNAFIDGSLDLSSDAVVSNERQYGALLRAAAFVKSALDALNEGVPVDAACSDVERGMAALAETDGRAVGEDIVAEIFSKFCVGK